MTAEPVAPAVKGEMALQQASHRRDGRQSHGGTSPQKYQLHLWVNEKEHSFLKEVAAQQEESMAQIVRRMIRQYRHDLQVNQRL